MASGEAFDHAIRASLEKATRKPPFIENQIVEILNGG